MDRRKSLLDTARFWFGDLGDDFSVISANCFENKAPDHVVVGSETTAPKLELEMTLLHWRNHFTWAGTGPMPLAEREKLRAVVKKAHRDGRRVRFWNTPEKTAVWAELYAADVDLINTDDLARLQRFLLERKKPD